MVDEYDEESTLIAHYDWNDVELLRTATINSESTSDIHLPLADSHNNIRQLINPAGNASDIYHFDAWGNQL